MIENSQTKTKQSIRKSRQSYKTTTIHREGIFHFRHEKEMHRNRWKVQLIFEEEICGDLLRDNHLTSLTYIEDGASFNPKTKLSRRNARQMVQNDLVMLSQMNIPIAGVITSIIALRRPNPSDRKPLKKLPNGWPMFVRLAAMTMWNGKRSNLTMAKLQLNRNNWDAHTAMMLQRRLFE